MYRSMQAVILSLSFGREGTCGMRPYIICCLTYKVLDDLVREALSQMKDPEVEVITVEGLREGILEGLQAAEAAGAEVIIGGGANAQVAAGYSGLPVIQYRVTAYDYLSALDRAFQLGNNVALCGFQARADEALRTYIERLGTTFTELIYESTEDLERKMVDSDCEVFIGAAHVVEVAQRLGRKAVLIYSGQRSILDAIQEAKKLAEHFRRRNKRSKFAQSVIDHSTNGILQIDPEGLVLEFNAAARKVMRKPDLRRGMALADLLPGTGLESFLTSADEEASAIYRVGGLEVYCKWIKLRDRSRKVLGVTAILSGMAEISRAELEYQERQRHERLERGFTAKLSFQDIVGESASLTAAVREARFFAASDSSLLLYGETGVGKEIFAQSIHNASPRRQGPFIAVNCAALPENLLESELFGYDDGAFTGGRKGGKKGLFELAGGGSIFLDEIGELPPALQSRLLRVLQEHEIMRVGGDRIIPVDVRIVSATNRDLENLAAAQFRRDLYYRLSVLELRLPSLRERDGDAAILFRRFYTRKCGGGEDGKLAQELDEILRAYSWPGNIRELQNAVERLSLYLSDTSEPTVRFQRRSLIQAIGEERLAGDVIAHASAEDELLLVDKLQRVCDFTKEQAAKRLGISRTTLWRQSRKQMAAEG